MAHCIKIPGNNIHGQNSKEGVTTQSNKIFSYDALTSISKGIYSPRILGVIDIT